MKTIFLTFLTYVLLASCSKDDKKADVDKTFQLPAETQTGANTFGLTIRGKVYVPRDPTGVNVGGATAKGMRLYSGLKHFIKTRMLEELDFISLKIK